MDSLSQMTLGVGVGEAILGKKVGNKTILWGALLGTVPDLDVIPGMFMDPINFIFFHRGFSHSLAFFILAAPIFGWVIHKIHKKETATWWNWTVFAFWVLFTHALLDCFTSWGTQLFWPLDYRVAWNSIFIVDPLYTVPFLITIIWLAFYKRNNTMRRKLNYAGLIISTAYLMLTVVNKTIVNNVFEQSLAKQNISYERFSTKNTPLNNVLWFGTVESDSVYHIGYYSFLDKDEDVIFYEIDKNHELLEDYTGDEQLRRLLGIMKGYYAVRQQNGHLLLHDLRFGQIVDFNSGDREFVFSYILEKMGEQVSISQKARDPRDVSKGMFKALWLRIMGNEEIGG